VVVASVAVLAAVGGDVHPYGVREHAAVSNAAGADAAGDNAVVDNVLIRTAAVSQTSMCCLELAPAAMPVQPAYGWSWLEDQQLSSHRWRVVDADPVAEFPVGDASEYGLQVQTILTARAISELFPEIPGIGGYRVDPLRWHPEGLAIDVMIPNWQTVEGKDLGDQIVAFVMANAERLGIQHAIWRGVFYSHDNTRGVAHGDGHKHGDHYDHVHIATFGGGYPKGHEIYYR
jgi:hypothetical protein